LNTVPVQVSQPFFIVQRLSCSGVLAAIEFHGKPSLYTKTIQNIWTAGILSAKFGSCNFTATEQTPEELLSIS
jgi:hypothetical protein